MRKIILFIAMALPMMVWADDNDTVVINSPKRVTVITNDSLQKIVVNGKENDNDYVYRNTIQLVDSNYTSHTTIGRERWSLIPKVPMTKKDSCGGRSILVEGTAHIWSGWLTPTSVSDGLGFSFNKSYEIALVPLQFDIHLNTKGKSGRNVLSFGIGLDWRNYHYRLKGNDVRFMKDEQGKVTLGAYPEGAKSDFSRLLVFSLSFPLLYKHWFGHGWGFAVGPVFNWNTYGSLKSAYEMDGGEYEFVEKHIGQRKFTIDYMLIMKNPILDLYVKYSNMNVLKNSDLKFRALSFGIYF